MAESLFPDLPEPDSEQRPLPVRRRAAREKRAEDIRAIPPTAEELDLKAQLPAMLRLGTSSWNYPGWAGLVWEGTYDERVLSRKGLEAYAHRPLFTTVCIDRSFYRPLTRTQYAGYAAQTPEDFRFVVKAPSAVTDALVRDEEGRGRHPNPAFLDPDIARNEFIEPTLDGLGTKVGALVFELSPLPTSLAAHPEEFLDRLGRMLECLPDITAQAPDGVIAVEVRTPSLLTPAFAATLRRTGTAYCLGLHAKMPTIHEQLPMLRAMWPAPLVCRWNLNRLHGAYGYESAQRRYAPYDQIRDPDVETRKVLARVAMATARAGYPAYVTISNQAEGSAPLTILEFARLCAQG